MLIQKDTTDDKVLENKKKLKKEMIEWRKCFKFVVIRGNFSVRKCPLNKVHWILIVFVNRILIEF